MSAVAQHPQISDAHLRLLEKYANADPVRMLVNLLILKMLRNEVPGLMFAGDGPRTEILIRSADGYSQSPDWKPIPVPLERIHRRLTSMSNPPLPCWHKLPFWYRLSFQITERVDHWLWHPRLMERGKFEIWTTDASHWVDFKCQGSDIAAILRPLRGSEISLHARINDFAELME